MLVLAHLSLAAAALLAALPELELDALLARVREHAPAVRVQEASVAVATARVDAVGAWEDPMVTVMAEDVPWRDDDEAMEPMLVYRVEQPLNVFGRRAAAKDAARARAGGELARLRRARWDAQATAVRLFYELWKNGARAALLERQIAVMARTRDSARARYVAGLAMAHHDYLRAVAEIARMEAERASLEDERRAIEATLNVLQGAPPDGPLGPAAPPQRTALPSLERLLAALGTQPEIAGASAMRAQMQARRAQAVAMFYPMIRVGAQYQQVLQGMPDAWGAMVTFTVPLLFWDRQTNELDMAEAMLRAAEVELSAARLAAEAEVRTAWSTAMARERALVALEESAVPSLMGTVEAAEAEYRAGQSAGFLSLLEAVQALLATEERRLELVVQREMARFELLRLVGAETSP